MIVCSCNVLSDKQVISIVAMMDRVPTVSQVYAGLACRARCGQCAPTIKRLRDQASTCAGTCLATRET
jgi:bacterioferritin-associated ferredoxin